MSLMSEWPLASYVAFGPQETAPQSTQVLKLEAIFGFSLFLIPDFQSINKFCHPYF